YLTAADGNRYGFNFDPIEVAFGGAIAYRPAWTADAGVPYTLSSGTTLLQKVNGAYFQLSNGLAYNPARGGNMEVDVTLSANDGAAWLYNTTSGLVEQRSADGKRLFWSDSGVVAENGDRIRFERDGAGSITVITSPDGGQNIYRYDSSGDLVSALGLTTGSRHTYGYGNEFSHHLTVDLGPTSGFVIDYTETGVFDGTRDIAINLGSLATALKKSTTLDLAGGETVLLALTVTERELATALTGRFTLSVELTSLDFAPPVVQSTTLTTGSAIQDGGSSYGLFTVSTAGVHLFELQIPAGSSGELEMNVSLAGDFDGDADIDLQDRNLFLTAANAGDLAADIDRDGNVDAADRLYLDSGFGVVAATPPVLAAGTVSTIVGVPIDLDLGQFVTESRFGTPRFVLSEIIGGTISYVGGARVLFSPTEGFSGAASFKLAADNGIAAAEPVNITINVRNEVVRRIELGTQNLQIEVGKHGKLELFAVLEDETRIALPSSIVSFESFDPSVAQITSNGFVFGAAEGLTGIEIHALGRATMAGITVGTAGDGILLQFFPASYNLEVGETRQFIIRERIGDTINDVFLGDTGARYVVENSDVGAIDEDGRFTATKLGTTTVVSYFKGIAFSATMMVQEAIVGSGMLSEDGGLITSGGATVGIPAGTLHADTLVTVTAYREADAPLALPEGLEYAGGVQIEGLDLVTDQPVSLVVPAPAGAQPGAVLPLLQPVEVVNADGTIELAWFLADTGVVGEDGMIRTTSPPNLGLGMRKHSASLDINLRPSAFAAMFATGAGGSLLGTMAIIMDQSQRSQVIDSPGIINRSDASGSPGVVDMQGADGTKVYAAAGPVGDFSIPLMVGIGIRYNLQVATTAGLRKVGGGSLSVLPGEISQQFFALPAELLFAEIQPISPPVIESAEFVIDEIEGALLKITGKDFLQENPWAASYLQADPNLGNRVSDLYVTFEIGGRDTFDTNGERLLVGGRDVVISTGLRLVDEDGKKKLFVPLIDGINLADATITVSRPMLSPADGVFQRREFTSNAAKIFLLPRYGFAADARTGTVAVIDVFKSEKIDLNGNEATISDPSEVAKILLGAGTDAEGTFAPREVTMSAGSERAYVTLQGVPGISVLDAVGLTEIDMDAETPGIQHIVLNANRARPWKAAVDPIEKVLYVTDELTASVYVIDIDPFSSDYHKHVRTLNLGFAPVGLRGIDVAPDGSSIYVAAPARDLFNGSSVNPGRVIVLTPDKSEPLETRKYDQTEINVGPTPYDITATDDPNVILVTDRISQSQGLGVIRRFPSKVTNFPPVYAVDYVSMLGFGEIRYRVEGRNTQVFGVSNIQGVAFIPENTFEAFIGPHPSYALVTGYNRFIVDDPLHDPALAPIYAYNPDFRSQTGQQIPVSLGAGGNVGIIRNPLGNFLDALDKPRIVAATSPIIQGFPDNLAVSLTTGTILVPFQGTRNVFAYDAIQIISMIESTVGETFPEWGHYPSPQEPVPTSLSSLLYGKFSTVPIDAINPLVAIAGDVRFYTTTKTVVVSDSDPNNKFGFQRVQVAGLNYGVPPTGFPGTENNPTNPFAPIGTGGLPRGVTVQQGSVESPIVLVSNPLNQSASLLSFPNEALELEAGKTAQVEAHSGALQIDHNLVTYMSLGSQQGITLHYDSLRAEPTPIYYSSFAGLESAKQNQQLVLRIDLVRDGATFSADGLDLADAIAMGLEGGENFFKIPADLSKSVLAGAGIPIDLTEAPTGLYTLVLDYGLLTEKNGNFKGRMETFTQPYAVVNATESPFGAGWGMDGYFRIYPGDGGVLLVDGNGGEQIFLAPEDPADPFTSLSLDYSSLRLVNGKFERRMIDGTVYTFDGEGKLETVTDRNNNVTTYNYSGDLVTSIVDPVGLSTTFVYAGGMVDRIIDPAGRITDLNYDGNFNLVEIIDPDGSRRTFSYGTPGYSTAHDGDRTFDHLMISETHKRGNEFPGYSEPLAPSQFVDEFDYDIFGRIKAGTRIDDKQFSLKPAQAAAPFEPEDTSSPLTAPKVAKLFETNNNGLELLAKAEFTSFRGEEIQLEMNPFGQLRVLKDEDTVRQEPRVSETGLVTKVITQLTADREVETTFEYDAFGNVIRKTEPLGHVETYEYGAFNILVHFVDAVGRDTVHELDSSGNVRVTTITDTMAPAGAPAQTVTRYTYLSNGLFATITDAENKTTSYTYDEYGRITQLKYHDGTTTSYQYSDLTGNVHATVDENGNRAEVDYDAMNRITASRNYVTSEGVATVLSTSNKYDAQGDVVEQSNRNGVVALFAFDQFDRPILEIADAGELAIRTEWSHAYNGFATPYAVPFDKLNHYRYERRESGAVEVEIYDKHNRLIATFDALGRKTEFTYNLAGHLVGLLTVAGRITYTIDDRGRVIHQEGPTVEAIDFDYDLADRLTRKTIHNTSGTNASGDQVWEYKYTLFNQVVYEKNPEEVETFFTFNAAGDLTKIVESDGYVTEYFFDDRHREILRTEAGVEWRKAYYPNGTVMTVTDPENRVTSYVYDEMRRLVSTTKPEGITTTVTYDGEGNALKAIDAEGNVTLYEYDGLNFLRKSTNAKGYSTVYGYDRDGNRNSVLDPKGNLTLWTFDLIGRQLTQTDPEGGRTTVLAYDILDNAIEIRNPRGFTSTYIYDKSGRLTSSFDELLQETRYFYDQVGNLTKLVGPQGEQYGTEFFYDRLNRQVAVVRAPGTEDEAIERTEYYDSGLVKTNINALGQITEHHYDEHRFLRELIVAKGTENEAIWRYVYDNLGNLREETDPRGGEFYTVFYDYDDVNRLIETRRSTGTADNPGPEATVTFAYDKNDNLRFTTDPRNAEWITEYRYNEINQLASTVDAAGYDWFYEYDGAGNLALFRDPNGHETSYEYDGNNRLQFTTNAKGEVIENHYDANGNTDWVKDAKGYTTHFNYDPLDRLTVETDPGGYSTTTGYDTGSNVISVTDARGFETTFGRDFLNRIVSVTRDIGNIPGERRVTEFTEYDAVGNVTKFIDARGSLYETQYDYDHQNRLVEQRVNLVVEGAIVDVLTSTYSYDSVGNMLTETDPRGEQFTRTNVYDVTNQPVSVTRPVGELAMNLTAEWIYEYDTAGNLIKSIDPRGDYFTTEYTYDALGRISSISTPQGSPEYVKDPVVEEFVYDPAGNLLTTIHARTGPGGQRYTTTTTYDELNRRRLVTDAERNTTEYIYDANGNVEREILTSSIATVPTKTFDRTYDERNLLRRSVDAQGFITTFDYDELGQPSYVSGPLADENGEIFSMSYEYNGFGLVSQLEDAEGNVRFFGYDEVGNMTSASDGRAPSDFYTSHVAYDSLNRKVAVTNPTGTPEDQGSDVTTRYEYDGVGNVVREIDPRGEQYASTYRYNAAGQLAEIRRVGGTVATPVDLVETFEYDLVGNLVRQTDARGEFYETTFIRDASGRALEKTVEAGHPDFGSRKLTEYYDYDAEGNLLVHVEQGGEDHTSTFVYDGLGNMASAMDAFGLLVTMQYDRYGNLVYREETQGRISYVYDALDRVVKVTDPLGHDVNYNYQGNRNTVEVLDAKGGTSTLIFDSKNRQIGEIDPLGNVRRSEYDAVGNLIRGIDERGTISQFTYDARNLVVLQVLALNQTEEVTTRSRYDELGRLIEFTPGRGEDYNVTYEYDNRGGVIAEYIDLGPEGGNEIVVNRYEYDEVGNVVRLVDGRGEPFAIEQVFDGLKRTVQTTRFVGTPDSPATAVERRSFDDAGNLVEFTDAEGHATKYGYDLLGRLISRTTLDALLETDVVETWEYFDEADGLRIVYRDQLGTVAEETKQDQLGREIRVTSREGGTTVNHYDSIGNLELVELGTSSRAYEYDGLNRVRFATDEEGKQIEYRYDATGNREWTIDQEGDATHYVYDRLDRLSRIESPSGEVVQREYDKDGNVIRVTDAQGVAVSYEFDGMGRIIRESSILGVRQYGYDAKGNIVKKVDRNGSTVEYAYDGLGNMITERWLEAGSQTLVGEFTYRYDRTGLLKFASDGTTTMEFTHSDDVAGRLISVNSNQLGGAGAVAVTYDWNALGQKLSESVTLGGTPLFTSSFSYDAIKNRLESIAQQGAVVTSKTVAFEFLPEPQLVSSVTRSADGGATVITDFSYDARNLLASIIHRAGSTVIDSYSYTYHPDARVETIVNAIDGKSTYGYDDGGQLISVDHENATIPDEFFAFDSGGNLVSEAIELGEGNRIQTDGTYNYTYDAEGNMATRTAIANGVSQEFIYDHRNRLVEVHTRNAANVLIEVAKYGYDPLDRRISKQVDSTPNDAIAAPVRHYIYSGENVIAEFVDSDGVGAATASFDRAYLLGLGADEVFSQDTGSGQVVWFLPDHLGSFRDVVNRQGQLIDHTVLDSYGLILSRTNPSVDVRHFFTGREFDPETGFYQVRARYLDPVTKRFTQEDPDGLRAQDTNLYRYVLNDPANTTDSSGRNPFLIFALIASIGIFGIELAAPQVIDTALEYWTSTSNYYYNTAVEAVYTVIDLLVLTPTDIILQTTYAIQGAATGNYGKLVGYKPQSKIIGAIQQTLDATPLDNQLAVTGLIGLGLVGLIGAALYFPAVGHLFIAFDIIQLGIGFVKGDPGISGEALGGLAFDAPDLLRFGLKGARSLHTGLAKIGTEIPGEAARAHGIASDQAANASQAKNLFGRMFESAHGTFGRALDRLEDLTGAKQLADLGRTAKIDVDNASDAVKRADRASDEAAESVTHLSRNGRDPPSGGEPAVIKTEWNEKALDGRVGEVLADAKSTSRATGNTIDSEAANVDKIAEDLAKRFNNPETASTDEGITPTRALLYRIGEARGVSRADVDNVVRVFTNPVQAFEKKIFNTVDVSKMLTGNSFRRSLEPLVARRVGYIENVARSDGPLADTARAFLDIAFSSNVTKTSALGEVQRSGDFNRSIELLNLLNKQDPLALLTRFKNGDSIFLADDTNRKALETIQQLLGFGDIILLGGKGQTLKQMQTYQKLIDDVRAMDDLERAVFFKRVYNDPSIRAEGVDAEGLIIKFEKSLASGGFNPESTDLDIVIVATEKLVGKFDSDTRFGRDIFAGRSEVPDGYFSARAIGDYSKPSYKHLENKAALELEATVKGSELEAARQAFNDQIFFSAFLGKALGTEIDVAAWIGRETSQYTRLGGQIVGLSSEGKLLQKGTPPAKLLESVGLATIQNYAKEVKSSNFLDLFDAVGAPSVRVPITVPGTRGAAAAASPIVPSPIPPAPSFLLSARQYVAKVQRPASYGSGAKDAFSGFEFSGNVLEGQVLGIYDPFGLKAYRASGNGLQSEGQDTTSQGSPESVTNPVASTLTFAEADDAVGFAIDWWAEAGVHAPMTLYVSISDLPTGQLGTSSILSYTDAGLPKSGSLVLDVNADGAGWFIDSSPFEHDGFLVNPQTLSGPAVPGSDADGRFDLITVIAHELGHLYGFTDDVGGFAGSITTDTAGQPYIAINGSLAALTDDRDHLHSSAYADDLMNATLRAGIRRLPSALDAAILLVLRGGGTDASPSRTGSISFLHDASHLLGHGGFVLLAEAVKNSLGGDPPTGVRNGTFSEGQSGGSNFAWKQFGAVAYANGVATLSEGNLLFTDLSQTFVLPEGSKELRFTVSGLNLNSNAGGMLPPDAFEVA
ncbi:MAG: hypothetical protein KDN22_29190, partial [Verrucomicrobiae bacterium]|nr:hypothetical protein [Verrucomicrobiae bacterium]